MRPPDIMQRRWPHWLHPIKALSSDKYDLLDCLHSMQLHALSPGDRWFSSHSSTTLGEMIIESLGLYLRNVTSWKWDALSFAVPLSHCLACSPGCFSHDKACSRSYICCSGRQLHGPLWRGVRDPARSNRLNHIHPSHSCWIASHKVPIHAFQGLR